MVRAGRQVLGRGCGQGSRPELLPPPPRFFRAREPSGRRGAGSGATRAGNPSGCPDETERARERGPGQAWRWRKSQPGKMETAPGGGGMEEEDFGGSGAGRTLGPQGAEEEEGGGE